MFKYIFITISFIFNITFACHSQNKADSLINLYHHETNPDKLVELSYEIGKLILTSDPDQCKEILFNTISYEKEITERLLLGKNYNLIGILYQYQSMHDSADHFMYKYLDIAKKENNNKAIGGAFNNLAITQRNQSNFEEAIELFISALKIYEEEDMTESSAGILADIGNTYFMMEYWEMGLEYHSKTIDKIETIDPPTNRSRSILANTYNSFGYAYDAMDITDSAIFYYELALEKKKELGNLYSWCNSKNNLCNILRKIDTLKCIQCHEELLGVQEKINKRQGIIRTKMNLAVSYSDMGDAKKSLEQNLDIIENYFDLCDLKMKLNLYKNIGAEYFIMKDYKNAYKARIKYSQYRDTLMDQDNSQEVLDMTEKYQSEKKDKEIASQKLEITEANLKVSNRNKMIFALGGGALTILFLALFIIQRNRRKAQKEKHRAIIEEKEKGLIAVFNAQEDERKRVAKDLHDGIGQQISAMNMNFQTLTKKLDPEQQFSEDVEKVKQMITETGNDIRNLSHQMMPRALTEFGLVEALEDMIEKSFTGSEIKCKYEHHNISERLPQNMEIGLYRIAQELINNIIKHSEAKQVDIQLMKTQTHCILMVSDDGKGIDVKESSGIGMQNMNSRIDSLNGELNIESDKNSGTTAVIKIKL